MKSFSTRFNKKSSLTTMSSSDSPFCVKKEFDNTLIKRMQSDIGEQNWNVLILLFVTKVFTYFTSRILFPSASYFAQYPAGKIYQSLGPTAIPAHWSVVQIDILEDFLREIKLYSVPSSSYMYSYPLAWWQPVSNSLLMTPTGQQRGNIGTWSNQSQFLPKWIAY